MPFWGRRVPSGGPSNDPSDSELWALGVGGSGAQRACGRIQVQVALCDSSSPARAASSN